LSTGRLSFRTSYFKQCVLILRGRSLQAEWSESESEGSESESEGSESESEGMQGWTFVRYYHV